MSVVGDRGLDVAWDEPPSWQHCYDLGYRFVMQYLSTDASKNADPEDIGAQRAAGIDGGYVWETTASRSAAGYAAGKADAAEAERQADALGIGLVNPDGTPIALFFATDFDASPDQVRPYYQGARDAKTKRPIGCYGSLRVVDAMLSEGIVRYGWQTVAWSGGKLSTLAHLYQRAVRTLPDPGGSTDENVVLKTDCGLWLAKPAAPAVKPPAGNGSAIGEGTLIVAQRPNAGTFHAFAIGADGQIWGVQWGGVFSSIDGNVDEFVLNPKWTWAAYGGDPIPGSLAGSWSNDGRFFRLFYISRTARADGLLPFRVREFDALPNKWSDWAELPNASTAPQFALTPGPAGKDGAPGTPGVQGPVGPAFDPKPVLDALHTAGQALTAA